MDEPAPPPPPCASDAPPPPPPPPDGEMEEGEIDSPVSCHLSPRGTKRADIDDDDGAGPDTPPHKQQRIEQAEGATVDFVPPSEHADLQVIDDIGGSDGEDDEGGDNGEDDDDSDWIDTEEIDTLLDEGVKDYQEKKEEMAQPVEKEKIVLIERTQELFDVLPEGWISFTHDSGMPIFLHRPSRVVTMARPYFLGSGSARKHDIPLSAIPCLQYRQALDKEKEDLNKDIKAEPSEDGTPSDHAQPGSTATSGGRGEGSTGTCPVSGDKRDLAKEAGGTVIATAEEYRKENSLGPVDLRKYCENLFQFRSITVKRFKTWKDKRKHHNAMRNANRPALPANTKLITRPVALNIGGDKPIKKVKEVVLNPVGKSDVCILHEYVQHALRLQPKFEFAEMQNAAMPYSSTVIIDGTKYGTGYGSSKKMAKNEAASKTLEILIPELKKKIKDKDATKSTDLQHDLALFDEIKIDDPRVTELCNRAGQPNPYSILAECIRRNHGLCDMNIQCEMDTCKHQKSEFTMRVGKHEAKVIVKNKREGKQLAAQKILQLLHPHINCWGSLLRLYGSANMHLKEKKDEESVTEADEDSENSPPVVSQRKSTRQSKRQTAGRGRAGKPAATGGRALRNKAANQRSSSAEKLEKAAGKPPSVWHLSGPTGMVFEFTVMEYGALGEIADDESILVADIPVKEESTDMKMEEDGSWNDVMVRKEFRDESTQSEAVAKKEIKKEFRDASIQVEEEKMESSTQVHIESSEHSSQVAATTRDAATATEFVKKSVQVQACAKLVCASTGSLRSFATTKDAASETIKAQTRLKDVSTATVRHHVLLKDAEVTADIPVKNTTQYGHHKSAQTALKGWQTASLDVSVQQSNGSFRVQSLDVGADDGTINRPLRVWFPPTGTDAVCQTDIKGWLDTQMDVITQGEDGSFYLKKSQEHGALPTDLVYRPYRVHRAIQATWVGNQTFHMATQTAWDGSSTFHKATQCPDPQKSEEQMGQSVLYTLDKGCPVGLTPTITPFTSAPTVTSLLATLGLPSTEESPLLSMVQTPIMSSVANAMPVISPASGGVQPMDLDTEVTPSSILESQAPAPTPGPSLEPSVSIPEASASVSQTTSTAAAATESEGERVIMPSVSTNSVMSFAGYNQFALPGANPFGPFASQAGPAGAFPMQQYTFIPQYPGMPPGYNFYPGWM